jgi:hypothetical protein
MTGVSLIAMPRFDPSRDRVDVVYPQGASIAEMIGMALPELQEPNDRVRVWIDGHEVYPEVWRAAHPKAGTHVVIRPRLGKDLRTILGIVVSVAALALGQFYAPLLLGSLGLSFASAGAATAALGVTQALLTGGILLAGNLLINALVPAASPDKRKDIFTVNGFQNQATPDAPVPAVMGKLRYAPPYAALPYTEIVGDDTYVIAAFLLGYGPLAISDHKLGDTAITEFEDVQMEVRAGYPDDDPLSLYPQQVIQESFDKNLEHDQNVVDGTPVVHRTARDVTEFSVDISFPSGLVKINDNGDP